MNELQEWCKKILPVVQAAANGEDIEICVYGKWVEAKASAMSSSSEYRIKPRTIKIGDVEVPEPMREAPDVGQTYFVVDLDSDDDYMCIESRWDCDNYDERRLMAGICHSSKDAATAHAKALIALTAK
ncbi:MAG: hypothetical protein RR390_00380 [Hafnia sp.]